MKITPKKLQASPGKLMVVSKVITSHPANATLAFNQKQEETRQGWEGKPPHFLTRLIYGEKREKQKTKKKGVKRRMLNTSNICNF